MTVPDPQTERAAGAGRVLGLLVLVLLGIAVWWFLFADSPERTVDTEVPAAGAPVTQPEDVGEESDATGPELAAVMADPGPYVGRSLEATATVARVMAERALWIEADVMDVETAGLERILEPLDVDVRDMVETEGHFLLVAPRGVVSPMAPSQIAQPGDTLG